MLERECQGDSRQDHRMKHSTVARIARAGQFWRWTILLLLVAIASNSLESCQGSDETQCEGLDRKLASCGIIPHGARFQCVEPFDKIEVCYVDCQLRASCADLNGIYCSASFVVGNQLQTCGRSCLPVTNNFTCQDGTILPASQRCDRVLDCNDGSDEAGCPTFTCQNGDKIPVGARCDGTQDCSDGSDEVGCLPSLDSILTCN